MKLAINNWLVLLMRRPDPAVPMASRLHWALRRLGRPGVVGIGVLAMCPVLYFSAVVPAQQHLDTLYRHSAMLGEQTRRAAAQPRAEQLSPAEQLASFYRIFPVEKDSPRWIEKLMVLAKESGIVLDQGEYKVVRGNVGKLAQMRMTFPVKGDYGQIRKFLSLLPIEIPGFSLENVQFERQKVSDPQVEARIRLVLYLGQAS